MIAKQYAQSENAIECVKGCEIEVDEEEENFSPNMALIVS
jgi:hypothetical protein